MRFEHAREKFRYLRDLVRDNKDVIIPITAAVTADVAVRFIGYQPFNDFDKIVHFLAGYGTSRLGRKVARKLSKEKYEDLASIVMNVGTSVGFEFYESYPPLASIEGKILEAIFHKGSCLSVFDPYDVLANFSGSLVDNISEYVSRKRHSKDKT
jgi:uncharacterized membrane protein YjdF